MVESNQEDQKQKKKAVSQLNSYAKYSQIVIQMIAIIGIGTFAGMKLDERFTNGGNTWTLILSLASVCLSLYFVIRRVVTESKDD